MAEVVVDVGVDAKVVKRSNFQPVATSASGRKFGVRHRPEFLELQVEEIIHESDKNLRVRVVIYRRPIITIIRLIRLIDLPN